MATAVAKGNNGVCTTDANRESVSRTDGGGTDIRSSNAVLSVTKNLDLHTLHKNVTLPKLYTWEGFTTLLFLFI